MRPIFSPFLLLLAALLSFSDPLPAAEPFYIELLNDSREAFQEGEFERAKKYLPLACFGLLEDPELLAEALTYLALTQKQTDFEHTDLLLTLERLVDAEDRFGAYSLAELTDEARDQMGSLLAEKIPPERLFSIPAFADLAREELQRRVRLMPPEARLEALEMHLAAEPDEPGWLVIAAESDLENGTPADALERIAEVLEDGGDDLSDAVRTPALCLRGRALSRLGRCEEAIDDLPLCGSTSSRPDLIEPMLKCYVRLGQWQEAEELVDSIPKPLRKNDALKPLISQVRRRGS